METLLFSTIFTLALGASLGFFFFLLHQTGMVEHYAEALHFDGILGIEEYRKWNENHDGPYLYYPAYISEIKGGFWGHLFGCPFCSLAFLGYWSAVLGTIIFHNWYLLIIGPTTACIGAITYLTVTLLYKKQQ